MLRQQLVFSHPEQAKFIIKVPTQQNFVELFFIALQRS